jgi:hypothetical protein
MSDSKDPICTDRLWADDGWTARVIKNEDDDGWAVEMTKDGEPEPALVGPWTMGRDKKNPKPLDANAFNTLVKTAHEVRRRHEQHMHAILNRNVVVTHAGEAIEVSLQIFPSEDDPYGVLSARAQYDAGPPLGESRVDASFRLTQASALAWIESGYRAPRR